MILEAYLQLPEYTAALKGRQVTSFDGRLSGKERTKLITKVLANDSNTWILLTTYKVILFTKNEIK